MFKRFNSLQVALLLHELSFFLLVLVTIAIGVIWSISWQKSSEESLRISMMNTAAQNVRGDVYRQLKEVFDASFLQDNDAADEYEEYTKTIESYLAELAELADEEEEYQAVTAVAKAYNAFYQETVVIFNETSLNYLQKEGLDTQLEQETFVHIEDAFHLLDSLLAYKKSELDQSRQRWSDRLTWLVPIPILLAIMLLIISRRFVNQRVVKPLADVIEGAKLISKGEFEHSISETGVVELERLSKAINLMAKELVLNREDLVETRKQAALGELVPLVAHNIRNPLAGIRAAAQVAKDEDIPESTVDTLTDIMAAIDRLERWVTSLLSYLHPLVPHLSRVKLTDVADDSLSLIELQLAEAGISLERVGWQNEQANVDVDVHLFEQLIFNLVQNSLEASAEGTLITLEYKQSSGMALLIITDQGYGMKSEQPLVENSSRLNCGLGIPFALKVIKQHDGELIYSTPKEGGTSVVISLKIAR